MIRCATCASVVAAGLPVCKACGTPTGVAQPPATVAPAGAPAAGPTFTTPVRDPVAAPRVDPDEAGATIFHDGRRLADLRLPPEPAPEPEPQLAPGPPRRGRAVGFGAAGAALLVLLVIGTTTIVMRASSDTTTTVKTPTTAPVTTPTTTAMVPSPPPLARLAAPGPGTVIGRDGAPAALVSVTVAVDGDATRVKQVVVLVDDVPQTPQTQFAAPIVVQVGPGAHTLTAKLVTDAGESPASAPVPIEVKDPKPGTCGELCFHASPELYLRPVPSASSATFGFAPATVTVVCQQVGGAYEGNQVWWDKLTDGHWVADQHLDTPKPAPASGIPSC